MELTEKGYLQINQALFSLTAAYESRMIKEAGNELSLADCSVLMVMRQFAPLTAKQLSEYMNINPGTISVYVQRLVKKGLINRQQDDSDRRNWWLNFTDKGESISTTIVTSAASYTKDFLSVLNKDEQSHLHQMLLSVSHSLGFDWQ
jgi:DNA-binding MarR family transcriptional regulator